MNPEAPAAAQRSKSRPARPRIGRMTDELSLAPLGVPLHVTTGPGVDPYLIKAACRGWNGPPQQGPAALRLAIGCAPGLAGASEPRIALEGRDLRLAGPGATGWASAESGEASCAVSGDYVLAPDRLRENVLDPLVLFLAAHRDRTPIHAAAFCPGDFAILAAGPGGSGKSCLTLAADRAGWRILSDDTVYLQRDPKPRLWGVPRAAHLLPEDCSTPAIRTRVRNGRVKHAVPLQGMDEAASAERAVLCVLARGRRVALEPLGAADAIARLGPLEPGFDLFPHESAEAFAWLASKGAWLLTLSADPAAAIALLKRNAARLRSTAVP